MTATGLFQTGNKELRQEWSTWLRTVFDGWPTTLTTLTFASRPWEREGTPSLSRVRRAAKSYETLLTKSLDPVSYFIVLERGGWNGRMHLHSLTYCKGDAPTSSATEAHRESQGFVSVRQVAMSAEQYVTKYVSKSDSDFWLAGGPLFRG